MYKHMLFTLLAINSNLALSADKGEEKYPFSARGDSPKSFIYPTDNGGNIRISIPGKPPRDLDLCDCLRSAFPWFFMRANNLLNPDGLPKKD